MTPARSRAQYDSNRPEPPSLPDCNLRALAFILGAAASIAALIAEFITGGLQRPIVDLAEGEIMGMAIWSALAGGGVTGALLLLLSALTGGLVLLATACGWVALGTVVPGGFGVPVLAPLLLSLLGSIAAITAENRPSRRRATERELDHDYLTPEDLEREEALSMDIERLTADIRELDPPPPGNGRSSAHVSDPWDERLRSRDVSPPGSTLAKVNLVLLVLLSLAVGYLYYLHFSAG